MKTIPTKRGKGIWVAAAVVTLLCCLSQIAASVDSWLAVRRTNGHDWLYILGDVEDITYGADELYVTTANGTDAYALDEVAGIDFVLGTTTVGVDGPGRPPVSVDPSHLFQNYPNPFSPYTQIGFDLPSAGRAEIRIYDAKGRLVRTLVDEKRPAGFNSVRWDGRDESGKAMASGVYFYTLTAPGVDENRRMVLVR